MIEVRDRTGTVSVLFRPGTTSVRSGLGTFLFRSWNMLSIFSVLSETVAMVSLNAPPTVVHIRCWAVNTVPAVGQTMQFGNNYLNDVHFTDWNAPNSRPQQLQLRVTTVAGGVLWSSWCHRPNDHLRRDRLRRLATAWTGGCMQSGQSTHKTRPRLVRPLWLVTWNWKNSCYVCELASWRQHQMTVVVRICVCGSVPARTNLCSYWFGLRTAVVGSCGL